MSEIANCTMQGRMSVFCPQNCKKCRLGVDNGPGLRYNNRRRREQHPGTPHGVCGRSSSGRAPPCQGGGSEFEPRRPLHLCGSLAQLGEHLPYKQRVSGSSPLTSTKRKAPKHCGLGAFFSVYLNFFTAPQGKRRFFRFLCECGFFGVFTGAGCGTKCGSKNQRIETTFFCVFFLLSFAKLSTFNEAFVNASSERCV